MITTSPALAWELDLLSHVGEEDVAIDRTVDHQGAGTVTPQVRRPARNVVVFQWPSETGASGRGPQNDRPWRGRVMLVLAHVSSIKTSRWGSRPTCGTAPLGAAVWTSGRSCSAACRVFFFASARGCGGTDRAPSGWSARRWPRGRRAAPRGSGPAARRPRPAPDRHGPQGASVSSRRTGPARPCRAGASAASA